LKEALLLVQYMYPMHGQGDFASSPKYHRVVPLWGREELWSTDDHTGAACRITMLLQ